MQTATTFAWCSKKLRVARCSICSDSTIRKEIRALGTAADLDEYTYLVAGCVGEFWTRLCFRHVRHFANRTEDEMLALGKALRHDASIDQCVARRRLRSSSRKMLFSRTRIKRGASDSLADPLRTGALPADLSNVAGESKGRSCVRNGIFARDSIIVACALRQFCRH